MMYRFSLRNQAKIAKALGEDYLKLLLDSLEAYFCDRTSPIDEVGEVKDNKTTGRIYIFIPSVASNSEIEFQFAVIRKTFDVYNLAYYSSVG
jgi:hypothetical protein